MDARRALAVSQLAVIAITFAAIACGSDGSTQLLGTDRAGASGAGAPGGTVGGAILPGADGSCPTDLAACSGVCVDTATDVGNCGACGSACSGTCALGRCVVTLATGGIATSDPGGIAVSGTKVYYFGTAGLMSVPVSGGAPAMVAPGSGNAIALSSTDLFWVTSTSVMSVPIAGGTPTTLATIGGGALAVNATGVYWTTDDAILSAPLAGLGDGGAPSTLAVGQNDPSGIALGTGAVYWTTGGTLSSSGGFAPNTGAVTSAAWSEPEDGGALDGGAVADGGGEVATLAAVASSQNYPVGIAVSAGGVYWAAAGSSGAHFNDGTIMSAPLCGVADGGAAVTLATAQRFPYAIAVDATTLYWTCNDNGGSGGAVMSVPLGGGAPVPLATGQSSPTALAVDATSVYWMTGSGALMKLTPK